MVELSGLYQQGNTPAIDASCEFREGTRRDEQPALVIPAKAGISLHSSAAASRKGGFQLSLE
jgi:hypothetical protein